MMFNLTMRSNIVFIKFKRNVRLLVSNCRYYDNHNFVCNRKICLSNIYDWSKDQRDESNRNSLLEHVSSAKVPISIIANYDTRICGDSKPEHHASSPLQKTIMPRNAILRSTIGSKHSLGISSLNFNHMPLGIREYSTTIGTNPPYINGICKSISESAPVEYVQESLLWLHATSGMSWWATIVMTAFLMKMITFPLFMYQNYIIAKVESLKYEMDDIVQELQDRTNIAAATNNWSKAYAMRVYKQGLKDKWKELIIRENCHPMKSLVLTLVQLPLWVMVSFAFRNLCYMLPHHTLNAEITYHELSVDGFGWITNLTDMDHFFILPITLGLLNLATIEVQLAMKLRKRSKLQKYMTNFVRIFSVCVIPLISFFPTGMTLYWISSSAFGLFYNFLIVSPRIRRLVRIPKTESELPHPYANLLLRIKRLLRLKAEV